MKCSPLNPSLLLKAGGGRGVHFNISKTSLVVPEVGVLANYKQRHLRGGGGGGSGTHTG